MQTVKKERFVVNDTLVDYSDSLVHDCSISSTSAMEIL